MNFLFIVLWFGLARKDTITLIWKNSNFYLGKKSCANVIGF